MRHVGVFGGSFDPPHIGHLMLAELLREECGLDEVLWMPASTSPLKVAQDSIGAEHRLAMVELAIAGNAAFRSSDLEIRRRGVSYTVDTLRELHRDMPTVRFALLMGMDSLQSLPRWREPEAIREMAELVVYRRPGATAEPEPFEDDSVRVVNGPLIGISSSLVRQRVREGRSIRYLVAPGVEGYIDRQRLYVE